MTKTGSLTRRMEMRVDDAFIRTVTELAEITHQSKAEVLRDALNLYYKAVNEYQTNGKGIVFRSIKKAENALISKNILISSTAEEACPA